MLSRLPTEMHQCCPGMSAMQPAQPAPNHPTLLRTAGCGPDAIKLFVGNIPKHLDEVALLPFFEQAGTSL